MDPFVYSALGTPDDDVLTEEHRGLLVSLRQSLSKSSVGSLLANYRASIQKDIHDTFGGSVQDVGKNLHPPSHKTHDDPSPNPEDPRPLSRRARPVSMAGVKQTVANIAIRGRARASSLASSSISVFSRISPEEPVTATVSSAEYQSGEDSTPPLTPDSTLSILADSPPTRYPTLYGGFETSPSSPDEEVDESYKKSRQEVRRGKRPQRIPSSTDTCRSDQFWGPMTPSMETDTSLAPEDDAEEWLGLDYALEASKADVQPQRVETDCAEGEYSKSRESWMAIHHHCFDPGVEEWAFQQWQRWHSQLEREDARRRAQRTMDYLTISTHRSWLYLQERKLRDRISSTAQRTVHDAGAMELLDSAEEQLATIEEYLQDTYDTILDRHDKVSLLRRSCSLSCIYD